MPRPTMDVNGTEYQEILKQRELRRLYKSDYPDVKWVHEAMDRLEKKRLYGDYTDQDYADIKKARAIIDRVMAKGDRGQEGRPTTHYIWRTRQDGKVRPEHAVNDGKIFAWDNPPPTGNPGDAFGCRCWGEPFDPQAQDAEGLQERSSQVITFARSDAAPTWTGYEFARHYFYGDGTPVALSQIGHLQTIISAAKVLEQPDGGTLFQRVSRDVREKARQNGVGQFNHSFNNSYEFQDFVYSIGGATVSGGGPVKVTEKDEYLIIVADIDYNFRDVFTDVFSIGDAIRAIEAALRIPKASSSAPEKIGEWDLPGSTPYLITDVWSTRIEATVKKDGSSKFPDDPSGE